MAVTDYSAALHSGIRDQVGATASRFLLPGISANVTASRVLPSTTIKAFVVPTVPQSLGVSHEEGVAFVFPSDFGALLSGDPHQFWFERVHVLPQLIELGNIVSTVTAAVEIYNAYREESRTVSSIVLTTGAGTQMTGFPGTPFDIAQQSGESGLFEATTEGPPTIDGDITITLDTGVVVIHVTGERVIFFPFQPEQPISETLLAKTNVILHSDGSEQRFALRKNPRQVFNMAFFAEVGNSRSRMQALLFGWHANVMGIPVWHEARHLNTDISIGATGVLIDTTFADFRVGSLAVVWKDDATWDVLEIASITPTQIGFSSAVSANYNANEALVIPVRTAITKRDTGVQREILNVDIVQLQFECLDNDSDLADVSAFSSFNGKVMLDDPNMMQGGTLPDNIEQARFRVDNVAGIPEQTSVWNNPRYLTQKGFFAGNAQRVWEVRQLMHALRGSQKTFYMPTFFADMVAVADLGSGSFNLDVEHFGYTDFIQAKSPNNAIWIELNDGTILTRIIDSSSELSPTVERLVVDVSWAATVAFGDIARISFLRLSRIADDRMELQHNDSAEALISLGVVAVQQ